MSLAFPVVWTYFLITGTIYALGGFLVYTWLQDGESYFEQYTDIVNQVAMDWKTQPFTDLVVTGEATCPDGTDYVMLRDWYGIDSGCDCLGRYSSDITTPNEMVEGVMCDSNQTAAGCRDVDSFYTVRQGEFFGNRLCGVQNAQPFLNATRVDSSYQCPSGYTPCTSATSSENTICYEDSQDPNEVCPILVIKFVSSSEVGNYQPPQWTQVYFNSSSYVVYSKEADQLPATTMRLEYNPCMDPGVQSAVPGSQFYGLELQRKSQCPTEKNTGLQYDPRFNYSDFVTNEWIVQHDNGVYYPLTSQPSYSHYVPNTQVKKHYTYNFWTRATIPWKLSCEFDGKSRNEAMNSLNTVIVIPKDYDESINMAQYECTLAMFFVFGPCLLTCCAYGCSGCKDEAGVGGLVFFNTFGRCITFIMAFITVVYLMKVGGENRDNIDLLDSYTIINGCSDQYTYIDTDRIENELNIGASIVLKCVLTMWGVIALLCCECCCLLKVSASDGGRCQCNSLSRLCERMSDQMTRELPKSANFG